MPNSIRLKRTGCSNRAPIFAGTLVELHAQAKILLVGHVGVIGACTRHTSVRPDLKKSDKIAFFGLLGIGQSTRKGMKMTENAKNLLQSCSSILLLSGPKNADNNAGIILIVRGNFYLGDAGADGSRMDWRPDLAFIMFMSVPYITLVNDHDKTCRQLALARHSARLILIMS